MRSLIGFLILILVGSIALAQEVTPEVDPVVNPIPLVLQGIMPNTATQGTAITVTLSGSGFTPASIVTIEPAGSVNATFISETQITIAVPATLAAGKYTVRVNNADGQTMSLPEALTIEALPTATPTLAPTATPVQVSISRTEPAVVISGQGGVLSVQGSNFTQATVIRLAGVGLLPTTYLHSGALTATLSETLQPGEYGIEVTDAAHGSAAASTKLRVQPAPLPLPTQMPLPTPLPLPEITREPALAVTSFTAAPNIIQTGQALRISFTVTNRGNQTANQIVVTLGETSSFVPAAGQASVSIPDLAVGGSHTGILSISASAEVPSGPVTIPLVMNYRDPEGKAYTSNASVSVTVDNAAQVSQLLIDAYSVEPLEPEAGTPVRLRMTVANLGNTTAEQVMLRITGGDNLLLPNGSSDVFRVGDVLPDQRIPLELSLIVNTKATAGANLQPMTLLYLQDGEAKEAPTSITLSIHPSTKPQPQMVLSRYDAGVEVLKPGERFTLATELQNVGEGAAQDFVVTFGTVQASTGDSGSGGDDGSGGNSNGGGTSTNTTPSTTFAPLGSAGVIYIGDIAGNQTIEIEQAFIVSGTTNSGIYNLPVTLRYRLADGTAKQDVLNISLVVVAPPRLIIDPPAPLPEMLNLSEPMPVSLTVKNVGTRSVSLTRATFSASHAEIVEGSSIVLQTLKAGEETSVTGVVMPLEEETVEVTFALSYLDELNQEQTVTQVYTAQVTVPEPPPIEEVPIEEVPQEIIEEPVDWFGRVMMALLGLGS